MAAINGTSGPDELYGTAGADSIDGGGGNDTISGGLGSDDIQGGDGNDTIQGDLNSFDEPGAGNDLIDGGTGQDQISGGQGNDTITGGTEGDYLSGNSGEDYIDGGDGDDQIWAFGLSGPGLLDSDPDVLLGGPGNDWISIGYGNSADGGTDNDTLNLFLLAAPAGLTFDLRELSGNGTVTVGGAAITNFEYVDAIGLTDFDDTVIAGARVPGDLVVLHIDGFGGNDDLTGTAGSDWIEGGDGDDTLRGDAGDVPPTDTLGDQFYGGAGNDTIIFDPDSIHGSLGDGGDGNDTILGSAGWDTIIGGAGDDVLHGEGGLDVLGGGDGADLLTGGDENDALGGGAGDDRLYGDKGDDSLWGGDGNDLLASGTGSDNLYGESGNDGVYMGAAFDASDGVDGGDGIDQVGLQGDYAAGLTLGANSLLNVEQLVLLAGDDTRFGDAAGNLYSYNLTTVDANVAAGQTLAVSFNTLRIGENVTFHGAAETDGSFLTYAGFGNDLLVGGQQSDGFFFGYGRWTGADYVSGQGGSLDELGLQGNYTAGGSSAIVFGAGQLHGIELIACLSGGDTRFGSSGLPYSYDLTMNDANVAAGQTLYISANTLTANETLAFDGSAESNGKFVIYCGAGDDDITGGAGADTVFGGAGADQLTGAGGNDTFAYASTSASTASAMDQILDFTTGDQISLSAIDAISGGANDAFSFIGSAAFSHTAGELRAYQSGGWFVEGDTDGNGVADLVIAVTSNHALAGGDFVL